MWLEERREDEDKRFWFYNGMHFPEPMPAFDMITAESCYLSIGRYQGRVFSIPTVILFAGGEPRETVVGARPLDVRTPVRCPPGPAGTTEPESLSRPAPTVNGTAITDNGTQFQCVVTNPQGVATSQPATLTVLSAGASYDASVTPGTLRSKDSQGKDNLYTASIVAVQPETGEAEVVRQTDTGVIRLEKIRGEGDLRGLLTAAVKPRDAGQGVFRRLIPIRRRKKRGPLDVWIVVGAAT